MKNVTTLAVILVLASVSTVSFASNRTDALMAQAIQATQVGSFEENVVKDIYERNALEAAHDDASKFIESIGGSAMLKGHFITQSSIDDYEVIVVVKQNDKSISKTCEAKCGVGLNQQYDVYLAKGYILVSRVGDTHNQGFETITAEQFSQLTES